MKHWIDSVLRNALTKEYSLGEGNNQLQPENISLEGEKESQNRDLFTRRFAHSTSNAHTSRLLKTNNVHVSHRYSDTNTGSNSIGELKNNELECVMATPYNSAQPPSAPNYMGHNTIPPPQSLDDCLTNKPRKTGPRRPSSLSLRTSFNNAKLSDGSESTDQSARMLQQAINICI